MEESNQPAVSAGGEGKPQAAEDSTVVIVFMIGPPGVGKSTHSASLFEDYGFIHLSTGDILREHARANPDTETSAMIVDRMRQALLVPDEMALSLTVGKLEEYIAMGKTRFLLDGFPRGCEQAEALKDKLLTLDVDWHPNTGRGIWLEAEEGKLLHRISRRAASASSESIRPDDEKEIVLKRLEGYFQHTVAFAEKLFAEGKAVKIDCNGAFADAYVEIKQRIELILH